MRAYHVFRWLGFKGVPEGGCGWRHGDWSCYWCLLWRSVVFLWLVLLDVVGALGDACNGGAMESLMVLLSLLVHVVVVVVVVDLTVNIT